MNMTGDNNDAGITIEGFEVKTNGLDSATARDKAEQRLREIDKRLVELKAERTSLNRTKHILTRFLK